MGRGKFTVFLRNIYGIGVAGCPGAVMLKR